jgi:hypothetical protein
MHIFSINFDGKKSSIIILWTTWNTLKSKIQESSSQSKCVSCYLIEQLYFIMSWILETTSNKLWQISCFPILKIEEDSYLIQQKNRKILVLLSGFIFKPVEYIFGIYLVWEVLFDVNAGLWYHWSGA